MRRNVALILAAALAAAACGARDDAAVDESAAARGARALFALSGGDEPSREEVDALFGPAADEASRAALLDAIAALGTGEAPRLLGERALEQVDRVVLDFERDLPAGGSAVFSVQLERSTAPPRIVWFSGPGVEWPLRTLRGDGLTVSAPPGDDAGG